MASGYPISGYRSGAAGYQGSASFQSRPPAAPSLSRGIEQVIEETLARPFRAPGPSVPSTGSLLDQAIDRTGRVLARRAVFGAFRAAGLAARFHPVLRAAFTLWDIYEMLRGAQQSAEGFGDGWETVHDCGTPRSRGPFPQSFVNCITAEQSLANEGKIQKQAVFVSRPGFGGLWDRYVCNFQDDLLGYTMFNTVKGHFSVALQKYVTAGSAAPTPSDYTAPVSIAPLYLSNDDPFNPLIPGIIRGVDPDSVAPNARSGAPQAIPHSLLPLRQQNPDRIPGYRWEAGNKAPSANTRDLSAYFFPRSELSDLSDVAPNRPVLNDGEVVSGPTIVVDDRSAVHKIDNPAKQPHPVHPPPKNTRTNKTKERKARIYVNGRVFGLLGHLTEGIDLIKALHDALPYQCRKSRYWDAKAHRHRWSKTSHKPQRMLADIYKCYEHMDMQKALHNVIANQVDDWLYGKVGSKQAKANRLHNRVIGFGAGGTNQRVSVSNDQLKSPFNPDGERGKSLGNQVADTITQIFF